MAEVERSRDAMRESLERLGGALQSTHDIDNLIQVVLDTAVATTDATGGIAVLADGGAPKVVAEKGLRAAGLPVPERVRPGSGVLGRVAAQGVDLCGRLGDPGLEPAIGEPDRGRVLAVPLRRGATVNGVIAVYAPEDSAPFSPDHTDAMRTLAGQAGIAVDNVRLHAEAERLSLTDAMTGLRNYRYLSMELAREIERSTRFGHPLAVVMLDIDHFKSINDTYGHPRGDAVLRELASRLIEVKREVDTLARYGGEEFAVILPETGADGAAMLAERICAVVRREPFGDGGEPIRVTVSVGVAAFPGHGASPAVLLRTADEALYAAKHGGRDQWRLAGG